MFIGVERRNLRRAPLADLYHNLIARSWGRLLGLVAFVYVSANLLFAALYDLGGDCIAGASGFKDLFFFSVQTLSTIGYGTMQLRVAVARQETSPDGERMRRFHDLKLQRDRNVIFVLTWTATHEIDETSPLYGLTIEEMKEQNLQLIASVIGRARLPRSACAGGSTGSSRA